MGFNFLICKLAAVLVINCCKKNKKQKQNCRLSSWKQHTFINSQFLWFQEFCGWWLSSVLCFRNCCEATVKALTRTGVTTEGLSREGILLSSHISGQDSVSCKLLPWRPQLLASGYLKAALSSLPCEPLHMATCFIKANKERLLERWKSESFVILSWKWHSISVEVFYWLESNYSKKEDGYKGKDIRR